MKQENRGLNFKSLDDVIEEVRRLAKGGYNKKGNWDLGQMCSHLADWALYPIDGYPSAPAPIRAVLALIRITSGKKQLKKVLENRGFGKGSPTMKESVPSDTLDEEAQIQRLADALHRLDQHPGPFHASPLFGDLDRSTWIEMNLIHAEHHLAYLEPKF
ncbi:MAG: DUF1569 domain-containing protein [Leptospiraceae bacterium]|nr:DUF1569 domain-containing protein [Leptospiraceae bacterium]